MKKPKKKIQKKGKPTQQVSKRIEPTKTNRNPIRIVLEAITFVCVVGGLIIAIATFWGPFWPTEPVVDVDGFNSTAELFRVPVAIKNPSTLFPVTVTYFSCNLKQLDPIIEMNGGEIIVGHSEHFEINPSGTSLKPCSIKVSDQNINRINVSVTLKYKNFFHRSEASVQQSLYWVPNHWSKGELQP